MGIKVVATKRGYYKRLIEPDQQFTIPSQKFFSKKWMKKFSTEDDKNVVAADPEPRRRTPPKPVEPETLKDVNDVTPKDNDWM